MMKKIILVISVATVLSLLTIYIYFKEARYFYLPYLEVNKDTGVAEVQWSDFYTAFPYMVRNETAVEFNNDTQIFSTLLDGLQEKTGEEREGYEKAYYKRILEFISDDSAIVKLDINDESQGNRALVVESYKAGNRRCTYIPLKRNSVNYNLAFGSKKQIHSMVSLLTTHCNLSANFDSEFKLVSFIDFIRYSIFGCFNSCEREEYVYVEEFNINNDEKAELEVLFKKRALIEEKKIHNIVRGEGEIEVSITKVIGSKSIRYVGYNYKNPVLGLLSGYAEYSYDDGHYKLVSVYQQSDLSYTLKNEIDALLKYTNMEKDKLKY